jgi:hypothetical protein
VIGTTAAGTLWIGAVTGGPFQDNENLTTSGGAAKADGTITVLFGGFHWHCLVVALAKLGL